MVKITGGDKLQGALDQIAKNLKKAASVDIGFLEDAGYYPGGLNIATVAAIQEFGAASVGIPPRPFFRNMIAKESPEWPKALGAALSSTGMDSSKALFQTGELIKVQLQESISDTNDPPLSPVTVMLRGMRANNPSLVVTGTTVAEARERVAAGKTNYGASTKPLVDTGKLHAAVAFKVNS